MAGSWKHMTTKSGLFCGTRYLENLGDCYEALEECYGMVWVLATGQAIDRLEGSRVVTRDDVMAVIEQARQHYEDGLEDGGLARKRIFGE